MMMKISIKRMFDSVRLGVLPIANNIKHHNMDL